MAKVNDFTTDYQSELKQIWRNKSFSNCSARKIYEGVREDSNFQTGEKITEDLAVQFWEPNHLANLGTI